MISHRSIWNAIDVLAYRFDLTCSGLAKKAGLDATTFNPSKRITSSGRERWPSSESIAKILNATGVSLSEFASLAEPVSDPDKAELPRIRDLPLKSTVLAEHFRQLQDDAALTAANGPVNSVTAPAPHPGNDFAIRIQGDSMRPFYQDGDVLVVSPDMAIRTGDKVAVCLKSGATLVRLISKITDDAYDTLSLTVGDPRMKIARDELEWIAKISWASQ